MLEKVAAQVDGEPCCTHIGPDGSGHFVKMVHNGIEYADMQAHRRSLRTHAHRVGHVGHPGWPRSSRSGTPPRLSSYLIEITAEVLAQVDAKTGKPLVDVIVDEAGQKGTGRWTVKSALDLGIPVTGIAEAVFARALSRLARPAQRPVRDSLREPWPRPRRCRCLHRRHQGRPLRVEGRRLRAGLRPDRRQRRVRLERRPRRVGDHLARGYKIPSRC